MVVFRREPSSHYFARVWAEALSHKKHENSPFDPRSYAARSASSSPSSRRRGLRARGLRALHLHTDRPDEAEHLACDRRHHLLLHFALRLQQPIASAQPLLRFPRDRLHRITHRLLALAQLAD